MIRKNWFAIFIFVVIVGIGAGLAYTVDRVSGHAAGAVIGVVAFLITAWMEIGMATFAIIAGF